MAWSSAARIADGVTVGAVEVFSGALSLDPDKTAHIKVDSDVVGVAVRAYTSLDGATWDSIPVMEFVMGGVAGSFILRDYCMVRLGFMIAPGSAVVTVDLRIFDRTG